MRIYGIIFGLMCVVFASLDVFAQCSVVPKDLKPGIDYAEGEVVVRFRKDVDGPEVVRVLKEADLKVKSVTFPATTMYVRGDKDGARQWIEILTASGLFESVFERLDPYGNPSGEIAIGSALEASYQEIREFIEKQEGLQITSEDRFPVSVVVAVPIGSESDVACRLSKQETIEAAGLNFMTSVDNVLAVSGE